MSGSGSCNSGSSGGSGSSRSSSSSSRRPPPYQPPLLPTLLRARSFYSVFTVRSSCHTTSSCLKIHSATLKNSASDLGGCGGGGGGGGGMMTTLVHRHPEQYLHKSRFTRYLQYFRDAGPSSMMMVDDGDHDDYDA